MAVDADLGTENGKVRLNIGDVSEPYLVDDDIIDAFLSLYPTESPNLRIYLATVDTLRYLKANFASNSSRRREKEGNVEIEIWGSEAYTAICDLLDWFETNPPSSAGVAPPSFIFGGVSKTEVARVRNDPDSNGTRARLGYLDDDCHSLSSDEEKFIPQSFYEEDF